MICALTSACRVMLGIFSGTKVRAVKGTLRTSGAKSARIRPSSGKQLVQVDVEDLNGVLGKSMGESSSGVRYAADYRHDPGGLGD